MTQFNLDKFLECLHLRLSPMFEVNTSPVNELADCFLATFAEIVDQFAPKRRASRKDKKLDLNPGYREAFLNQFKPKTDDLNYYLEIETIRS